MGHAVQWYLETLGAMSFPMEVHHPGVHVPPADEAGGTVTRTTTRSRSEHTQTGAGTCSISRKRIGVPPIRWPRYRRQRQPRKFSTIASRARLNKKAPAFWRGFEVTMGASDRQSWSTCSLGSNTNSRRKHKPVANRNRFGPDASSHNTHNRRSTGQQNRRRRNCGCGTCGGAYGRGSPCGHGSLC